MRNLYFFRWVVLGVLAVACVAQLCSSDEKKPPAIVRADDLCNGNCTIVGRLGKRYGEISKVRGVWEPSKNVAKPEGPSLRITNVDGKELAADRQIVVEDGFVKRLGRNHKDHAWPRVGEVLEGRVYESGGYPDSLPPKVQEILHPDQFTVQPQPPFWAGFAFHSFLYFID